MASATNAPGNVWFRRLRVGLVACTWLYFAVVLGSWALLGAADLWWPATLWMFSPRWLLAVPLVVLIPVSLVLRSRAFGLLCINLLLVLGPVMGLCLPWQSFRAGASAEKPFRVLTCNMHYLAPQPDRLIRLVDDTQPDVVTLQEWRGARQATFFDASQWHVHRSRHIFLASRHPIRQARDIPLNCDGYDGAVMQYELETPLGIVALFSLHLASPRHGFYEVVHEPKRGPLSVQHNSDQRWEQSEEVERQAQLVSAPVLLAGDFNTPSESAIFRRIWTRYTDAFSAAGRGWGYTFIGDRTTVRIDHILAGPGWRCNRCRVGPNIGSPHRPVLADLTLLGPGSG